MKIKINKDCIGCGTCEAICGEVFEIKEGKSTVKENKDIPCVDEAIKSCPVKAISKE